MIYDKFSCAVSPDGKYSVTGTYHNQFAVSDSLGNKSIYDATPVKSSPGFFSGLLGKNKTKSKLVSAEQIDYYKKVLYTAWHPTAKLFAVSTANNVFLYHPKA